MATIAPHSVPAENAHLLKCPTLGPGEEERWDQRIELSSFIFYLQDPCLEIVW